jgi:hypothetical protein
MGNITTVKVQKKTRDRLTKLGNKSETFDDIIKRLINFYEATNGSSPGKKR